MFIQIRNLPRGNFYANGLLLDPGLDKVERAYNLLKAKGIKIPKTQAHILELATKEAGFREYGGPDNVRAEVSRAD